MEGGEKEPAYWLVKTPKVDYVYYIYLNALPLHIIVVLNRFNLHM